jgi:lipid II isoglutaminyl synthase (glutamine-hydrolysing)
VKLRLAHLYPREMSLYGDTGNVLAVRKRLEWRGYASEVLPVEVGVPFDFSTVDMIIGGGGPDSGQAHVAADFFERGHDVKAAIEKGVPALAICGMYQLFGLSFTTNDGEVLPGIGVFDAVTVATRHRIVGDVELATRFGHLVGFENHSGLTRLGPTQEPFGHVVSGKGAGRRHGRRRRDDGAVSGSAIGTYLHGPVLPRNPVLADFLIDQALAHHVAWPDLPPLAGQVADDRPHRPVPRG